MNKIKVFCAAIGFAAAGALSHAQDFVSLEDFSNFANGTNAFIGQWEATGDTFGSPSPNAAFTQGVGVYNFINASTSDSAQVIDVLAAPVSIGSLTTLSLQAQLLSGNTATSLLIQLTDGNSVTASAVFDLTKFSSTASNFVEVPLNFGSGFNPNDVEVIYITGGNPLASSAVINISLNQLNAGVPEPSTVALLAGLGVVGFAAYRRRKAA